MIIAEPESRRQELVRGVLQAESTLVLATVSVDGIPHAVPLFYVCDGNRLFWFSSESSEHSINLEREGCVAASIFRSTERWNEICGLQMKGIARQVKDKSTRKAITKIYVERFNLGAVFRFAISRSTLYEFVPSWIRYINNATHFGYKFELSYL